jgi:dolichyl-phosphate-mannose-protein mannosyltransferase
MADEMTDHVLALIFTLLSFFTRLYRIEKSNIVTWDEAQYYPP